MDKEHLKEGFRNLSIKTSVADKFIRYSQLISKSRSVTLRLMLEFFEYNQIAPTESLGPRMQTLESSILKRINALVAIIRDIEKQQTVPTKAMLEALFEGLPAQTKKKVLPPFEQAFKNLNKNTVQLPEFSSDIDHKDIRNILRKIKIVKPPFGKVYYKVSLEPQEIKRLKIKYHVYHN